LQTAYQIKRILVPIDRSGYKEKIATYATSLSKAWEAEMTFIHVVEPKYHVLNDEEVKTNDQSRALKSRRQAEDLLSEIVYFIKNQNVSIKKKVLQPPGLLTNKKDMSVKKEALEGSDIVGKTIIEYAIANNFDVIVIGTRGMSEVEEYFFGSVANKVIHEAHCAVFAIR
jgi:nucleotide-binding universal stress UspA family protein